MNAATSYLYPVLRATELHYCTTYIYLSYENLVRSHVGHDVAATLDERGTAGRSPPTAPLEILYFIYLYTVTEQ